ncbi:hypothetical protein NEMIN01_2129 [Nematocida minor]|uniref:uncharacterized protein n=1 Tax=Nematocida minor TaxID=1912983 RepID=UPI00221F5685|nr:uncharacterized protein NEMIN01_2129 [Nematocida minor]KAI5192641.1 hypothetical protein NEMIN01_2129 [Nematocida minor]
MRADAHGEWLTSLLLFVIKGLRISILPFDLKVLLLTGIEYVAGYVYKTMHSTAQSAKEEKKEKEGESRPRKKAVILDGTSKHGALLKNQLIEMGYTVVYPGKEETPSDSCIAIPISIRNEESIDLFVKKVILLGRIDLLVVNSAQYKAVRNKIKPIQGIEKKIIPSRKKTGFISKNELYKESDRILLEKDLNARRNYLFNFLLIRGLSDSLKGGDGMVVLCVHRVFMLVSEKKNTLPSYSFSYCNSQLFNVFLGMGAKARYNYLDIRVIGCDFLSDIWIKTVEHCVKQKKKEELQYFNNCTAGKIEGLNADRANDIWENAEIIS